MGLPPQSSQRKDSQMTDEKSIEEIFEESWDSIACKYHPHILYLNSRDLIVIDNFIHNLMMRGLHKRLRAGHQLFGVVLSRSKVWGLRDDQPFIAFEPNGEKISVAQRLIDDSQPFTIATSEITIEVEVLLQKLLSHPID